MTPTFQPLTEVYKTHTSTNEEHLTLAQHEMKVAHTAGSDGPVVRGEIKAMHVPDGTKQP